MKKIVTLLTILLLLVVSSGCNKNVTDSKQEIVIEEGKYPITWDSTLLYKDYDDFKKDLDKLEGYVDIINNFRGKLDTVDGLLGYFNILYGDEFNNLYDKLGAYTNIGMSIYPMNQLFIQCSNEYGIVSSELYGAISFFDEEMQTIPYKKRVSLFQNKSLEEYAPLYSYCLQENMNSMSEDDIEFYNTATMGQGRMYYLFNTLANFEIPNVEYKTKSGEVLTINDGNLVSLFYKNYDIETKKEIYNAWWGNCSRYANSLAYILETQLIEQYSYARLSGFDSTKNQALYSMGFEEDIIQKIIDYAKEYSDYFARYHQVYANRDKTNNYYTFSKYKLISNYDAGVVNYDTAIDTILNALNVLGDEYTNGFLEIINDKHVDVYPNEQKSSGAFENGSYTGLNPFVMLNYNNKAENVSSIAHEMGHACYDQLNHKYQKIYFQDTAVFTQEVASLTNEMLFYSYMMNNAKTDDEKLFYMEHMLNMWSNNLYNSCFWQEVENYCHDTVENGGYLSADGITQKWIELSGEYYGDNLDLSDYGAYRWTTLNCLYNNYYEYVYATSMCYATVIAQNILNNVPNSAQNYLDFLKAGGSLSSIEALKIAGIDIYDDSVYKQAMEYFGEMVKNFENLAK